MTNQTDIEDDIEVEGDAAASPVAPVDWNEGGKNETGLRGAELIAEFVKRLPNSPGVYRMFNEAGDVLYVGKARSLKKRVSNYAHGPRAFQPHRPDGARDREHGVRHDAHRDRGAAARSESDQALAAALQRACCATTSPFPIF